MYRKAVARMTKENRAEIVRRLAAQGMNSSQIARKTGFSPGCGNVIAEEEDLSKVEYVRTKRATDVFFHTACMGKVWR